MKQRWSVLEPRQQLLAVTAVVMVTGAVLIAALLQVHRGELQARQILQRQSADLGQVQQLAAQYQARHASGQQAADTDLVSIVSSSLRDLELQPTRLQQNSSDELQVRLDAVPYDAAISWLAKLGQIDSVVVMRVTLTQGPNGVASLNLGLKKRQ